MARPIRALAIDSDQMKGLKSLTGRRSSPQRMVIDNYSTHKHPKVKSWIKWRNQRHARAYGTERIVLHFTPTSSSWMNLVERFFRDLTEDAIREGSFTSIRDLEQAIESYLSDRDENPKRYIWKAEGQEILAKIHRARTAMNQPSGYE